MSLDLDFSFGRGEARGDTRGELVGCEGTEMDRVFFLFVLSLGSASSFIASSVGTVEVLTFGFLLIDF